VITGGLALRRYMGHAVASGASAGALVRHAILGSIEVCDGERRVDARSVKLVGPIGVRGM
jgi:hypothetical protein